MNDAVLAQQAMPNKARIEATLLQNRAANPEASVWVSASAGTGKTKVLTDRLLRLMLPDPKGQAGTSPHRILCLTFTKVGAAEMKERITKTLRSWSVMSDLELHQSLEALLGKKATELQKLEARALFARTVDTPGGLKIMTIHSFCQSILARFPLEAGLTPNMEVIEEDQSKELICEAFHQVIAIFNQGEGAELNTQTLHRLLRTKTEPQLLQLVESIIKERGQFSRLLESGIDTLIDNVYSTLDIDPAQSIAELHQNFFDHIFNNSRPYYALIEDLSNQGSRDQGYAQKMKDCLDFKNADFSLWTSAFITVKEGDYKHRSISVKNSEQSLNSFAQEADRILRQLDKICSFTTAQLTSDLLQFAYAVSKIYQYKKSQKSVLDFDDLIIYTKALLDTAKNPTAVQWVMYKLDGGIDHILVDEAQDTNPEQWAIIQSLADDFFDNLEKNDGKPRTVFVVGDEKQSIFSFQRADPQEFYKMQNYFEKRVSEAQQKWETVPMVTSFRTAQGILDFVDQVFADEARKNAIVKTQTDSIRHISDRIGQPSHIEVWPLFTHGEKIEAEPWSPPTKIVTAQKADPNLAKYIADTIHDWIQKKRPLASKDRPIRAGDILVLVRSRGAFVKYLMRALKAHNIPVSGADRMIVKDELPVMDILAAMQFALLPDDDLTLATVLKSPFVDMDEETLFSIAYKREGRLWAALKDSAFKNLITWCEHLIKAGSLMQPFAFINFLLQHPCPANEVSGLRAITKRLGNDALEALEEFQIRALHYEQDHIASLQGFLKFMASQNNALKREQESGIDAVQIMTAHGAKGLESPIVFLPDTTRVTQGAYGQMDRLLWPRKTQYAVPLWAPNKGDEPVLYKEAMDRLKKQEDEEYRRLLYVAMTRAEDELYICGTQGGTSLTDIHWYGDLKEGITAMSDLQTLPFDAKDFPVLNEEMLVIDRPQTAKPDKTKHSGSELSTLEKTPPEWIFRFMPDEPNPPRPLTPSRPSTPDPTILSPLKSDDGQRFKRGNITHALLQFLPDLPPEKREAAARKWLSQPAHALSQDIQASIVSETLSILNNPSYAPLFGAGSQAEVPVTGLLEGKKILSGQIDRLRITDTEIWIIDYKSNRPSPDHPKDVPDIYIKQMKAYSDALAKIYPNRIIKPFLLWTDGPKLMPLPKL